MTASLRRLGHSLALTAVGEPPPVVYAPLPVVAYFRRLRPRPASPATPARSSVR